MVLANDLLLRTARGEKVERPPVWLMRQAGRILPQYRAIRSSLSGFKELVSTPQLAAEVTIQPVDELGVDAAIIFSDILVIPEAMGLDYELIEKKGPLFPKVIESRKDIDQLIDGEKAAERLEYVYDALRHTKTGLDNRVPLIGFSGAPWTLLSYMIEGQGSKTFSKARRFLYMYPEDAHVLLQKLTNTIIAYLKKKIENGCDIVQIFDSWAGSLTPAQYKEFAIPYLKQITDAVTEVPTIVFAKGAWFAMEDICQLNTEVVGLDWNMDVSTLRSTGTDKIFQGNLDPCQLYNQETVAQATTDLMDKFGHGHIVNLGHGVYPDTPLDSVKIFVNTVKNHTYS